MAPLGSRMRRIMLAAAALCLAGCGGGSGVSDDSVRLETGPNGEILVVDVSPPGDAVMEAAFDGIVTSDDAGCVIGSWDGNEVLLKFPLGTRFDGADILLPNGKAIQLGERAFFGGGYLSGEQNHSASRGAPEECLREETFLIQTYDNPSASSEQTGGSMKSADIWNRALDYDYDGPRAEGDRALHDLLMLDNVAQNGGLLHGVGVLDQDELTAAVAGYRRFGLDELADGIESVAAEAAGIDPSDPLSLPAEETLEERADDLCFGEQGSDLIDPAFEQKLVDKPDAFAGSAG